MSMYSQYNSYNPTSLGANDYSWPFECIKNVVRIGFDNTDLVLANDDREAETLNSIIIADNDGQTRNVTLADRTLYKDGDWNTICLPFAMDAEQIAASPLAGATMKKLDGNNSDLTDGTLTLNFAEATAIEAGKPYLVKWGQTPDLVIATDKDWDNFADAVNATENANTFEGKVVRLDADITISKMVGNSKNYFKGIFKGNGHTITLDKLSTDPDEEYCAPFRYVQNATICDLHTTGTVIAKTKKYRSGLIGQASGATINNCWSSVTISTDISGDGTHGGFIGTVVDSKVTINNCRFDGSIIGEKTDCCGGFVGWINSSLEINNSLFAPTAIGLKDGLSDCYTFGRRSKDKETVNDSYYTQTLGEAEPNGTAVGNMSNSDLLTALGRGWQEKDGKVVPIMGVVTNPKFTNVTIDKTTNNVESADGTVTFTGTYDYQTFDSEDKSVLFLGGKNTLYYPQPGMDPVKKTAVYPGIGACRAYFKLSDPTLKVKAFNMSFSGDIDRVVDISTSGNDDMSNDTWYTLDGRQLSVKPAKKGLYIHNGQTVKIQ